MEQLGELIVSKTISNQSKEKYRLASRGIIYKDGKVLMIYAKFYNDYTFPGGGVEDGEDEIVALERECSEEAGVLIKNIRPFFKTYEKREIDEETILNHESHYYVCDIEKYCETHLEDDEKDFGYTPVWITIDEAIDLDEKKKKTLLETDYKGVLERELLILRKLKESGF